MEACSELKQKYDACFNYWFSERFLKGDTNDTMCSTLLNVYKECVAVSGNQREIYSVVCTKNFASKLFNFFVQNFCQNRYQ